MTVEIDSAALNAMSQLLGDQFLPTLEFCFDEYHRLYGELVEALPINTTDAMRHAHSLKSNAAQFGATSLAELAKRAEHALNEGNTELANEIAAQLEPHIIQTIQALKDAL